MSQRIAKSFLDILHMKADSNVKVAPQPYVAKTFTDHERNPFLRGPAPKAGDTDHGHDTVPVTFRVPRVRDRVTGRFTG